MNILVYVLSKYIEKESISKIDDMVHFSNNKILGPERLEERVRLDSWFYRRPMHVQVAVFEKVQPGEVQMGGGLIQNTGLTR